MSARRKNQEEPSEALPKPKLLDERGQPLGEDIQELFAPLELRLRVRFTSIRDEAEIRNILDHAAQRYAFEAAGRIINNPEALAWTILLSRAVDVLRRSESKISSGSVNGHASDRAISILASGDGTPEQVFNQVYARQLFEQLTEAEQRCATLKSIGFSSRDIARALGTTVAAIDKTMQRVRDKFRSQSRTAAGGASS